MARILAVTDDEESLYPRVLAAIGEALEWDFGALWVAAPDDRGLVCVQVWSADGFDPGAFAGSTRSLHLSPGVGLPGRVWQSGEPAWLTDLPNAPNFPRASVADAVGLVAAFGFPIASPGGTIGVMEFFTRAPRTPDDELLATMGSLGSQIGQFVVRRRAEAELRDSAERKRAILDAALDCVITVDELGAVLEFNPAAERVFGYRAAEAVGADMADLVIPPSLRAAPQSRFRALRGDRGGARPRQASRDDRDAR